MTNSPLIAFASRQRRVVKIVIPLLPIVLFSQLFALLLLRSVSLVVLLIRLLAGLVVA